MLGTLAIALATLSCKIPADPTSCGFLIPAWARQKDLASDDIPSGALFYEKPTRITANIGASFYGTCLAFFDRLVYPVVSAYTPLVDCSDGGFFACDYADADKISNIKSVLDGKGGTWVMASGENENSGVGWYFYTIYKSESSNSDFDTNNVTRVNPGLPSNWNDGKWRSEGLGWIHGFATNTTVPTVEGWTSNRQSRIAAIYYDLNTNVIKAIENGTGLDRPDDYVWLAQTSDAFRLYSSGFKDTGAKNSWTTELKECADWNIFLRSVGEICSQNSNRCFLVNGRVPDAFTVYSPFTAENLRFISEIFPDWQASWFESKNGMSPYLYLADKYFHQIPSFAVWYAEDGTPLYSPMGGEITYDVTKCGKPARLINGSSRGVVDCALPPVYDQDGGYVLYSLNGYGGPSRISAQKFAFCNDMFSLCDTTLLNMEVAEINVTEDTWLPTKEGAASRPKYRYQCKLETVGETFNLDVDPAFSFDGDGLYLDTGKIGSIDGVDPVCTTGSSVRVSDVATAGFYDTSVALKATFSAYAYPTNSAVRILFRSTNVAERIDSGNVGDFRPTVLCNVESISTRSCTVWFGFYIYDEKRKERIQFDDGEYTVWTGYMTFPLTNPEPGEAKASVSRSTVCRDIVEQSDGTFCQPLVGPTTFETPNCVHKTGEEEYLYVPGDWKEVSLMEFNDCLLPGDFTTRARYVLERGKEEKYFVSVQDYGEWLLTNEAGYSYWKNKTTPPTRLVKIGYDYSYSIPLRQYYVSANKILTSGEYPSYKMRDLYGVDEQFISTNSIAPWPKHSRLYADGILRSGDIYAFDFAGFITNRDSVVRAVSDGEFVIPTNGSSRVMYRVRDNVGSFRSFEERKEALKRVTAGFADMLGQGGGLCPGVRSDYAVNDTKLAQTEIDKYLSSKKFYLTIEYPKAGGNYQIYPSVALSRSNNPDDPSECVADFVYNQQFDYKVDINESLTNSLRSCAARVESVPITILRWGFPTMRDE